MKKNLTKLVVLSALLAPLSTNLVSCKPTSTEVTCQELAKQPENKGMITLNFWHAFNNVNETAAKTVVSKFNDIWTKKDGQKVCVTMVSQSNYDTLQTQINSSITAGNVPDIVSSYPDHVADYRNENVVVDMNKFQNDPELAIPATGENGFDDFIESYQKESYNYVFDQATLDKFNNPAEGEAYPKGNLYSLPVNKSTEVMYYNKTFFDIFTTGSLDSAKLKNGQSASTAEYAKEFEPKEISFTYNGKTYTGYPWALKDNDGKEAKLKHPGDIKADDKSTWWTWDDVEFNGKIIQQITKNYYDIFNGKLYTENVLSNDPNTENIKKNGNYSLSWDSSSNLFISIANSYNKYTQLVKSGNKLKADLLFDDATVVNALTKFRNLYDNGIFAIPTLMGDGTDKYATKAFTNRAIFLSVGSTAGAAVNNGGNFEMGVAVPPLMNKDNPKIINQGTNVTILSNPAYVNTTKDATGTDLAFYNKQRYAWEFVKYLTSYEGNMVFAKGTTYFPTRQSVLNSDEYAQRLNELESNPNTAAEAQAIRVGLGISTSGAFFTDRPFPGSSAIRNQSETEFKKILSSTEAVSTIINNFKTDQLGKLKEF